MENNKGKISDEAIEAEEEIRQQAKDFYDKWLPRWEKYCDVCGACNCKNNDSCIKCNCQF